MSITRQNLENNTNQNFDNVINLLGDQYGSGWAYAENDIYSYNASNNIQTGPVQLTIGNLNNITSLNNSQLENVLTQIRALQSNNANIASVSSIKNTNITIFDENATLPYGKLIKNGVPYPAGTSGLHYVAYNMQGALTIYNITVKRSTPNVILSIDGISYNISNQSKGGVIHIPVITDHSIPLGSSRQLQSTKINGDIISHADIGNKLNYSITVSTTGQSINSASNNLDMPISLPSSGNTDISISVGGNSNYTSFDPSYVLIPTNILYYLQLTISNSQTSAISANTQIMIPFNAQAYQSYEAPDLSNMEFFDSGNGNPIPSWIEGNALSLSTSSNLYGSANVIIWIKMPYSISPSSSNNAIYVGFVSSSTNLFSPSGNTGEAPWLSSTYAQYDDGSSVFLYYNNGESSSGYTLVNAGNFDTNSITDPFGQAEPALQLYGKGSGTQTDAWVSNSIAGDNVIAEGWVNTAGSDSASEQANAHFLYRGTSATSTTDYSAGTGWAGAMAAITSSGSTLSTSGTRSAGWHWIYSYITGSSIYEATYTREQYLASTTLQASTSTTSTTYGASDTYMGIGNWAGSTGPSYFYDWRVREYPPGGIMPTVSFGSLITATCTFTVSNTAINFGPINPGTNIATQNAILITNTGNTESNVLISGSNWVFNSNTFGVTNTIWSWSSGVAYVSANQLTSTTYDTKVTLGPSTQNNIFFGVGTPAGQAPGTYSQTINIISSC